MKFVQVMRLILHLYGIAAIWVHGTRFFLLNRLYRYTAPVLVMQRRLAQLQRFRVYSSLLLGLPWWCLWVLCAVLGTQWLFGIDLYAAAPWRIYVSLAAGVASMGVCLWVVRRIVGQRERSPSIQRMIDDLSGRNLRRASRQLDEIVKFERELE